MGTISAILAIALPIWLVIILLAKVVRTVRRLLCTHHYELEKSYRNALVHNCYKCGDSYSIEFNN